MKLKFTIVLVMIMSALHFTADAQISFSCDSIEYCYWNDFTEEYEDCESYEKNSLFVMDEEDTILTHTIGSIKNTYYVSTSEWEEDTNTYTYSAVNDEGNDFIYMFLPDDNEVNVIFYNDDDNIELQTFHVKSIF